MLTLILAVLAPLLGAGGLLLWRREMAQRRRVSDRLAAVSRVDAGPVVVVEGPLRKIGRRIAGSRLFGTAEVARLRQNLYAAGFAASDSVEWFVGAKILLSGGFIAAVFLWVELSAEPPSALILLLVLLGALVVATRAPDVILARMAAARRERIDRGLPDALDLLVVCAEAGISIEQGLERVGRELKTAHPDLATELSVTVSEMRLLSDRLEGLHNMSARIRLDTLAAITTTLAQTLRYGTPLGKALRTLTADYRLLRQTQMEERAARLPVILTVPMIMFILPATAAVVAGPAFLQLIEALKKL